MLLLLIIFNDTVGMKIPLISDLLSSIGTVTFDNEINSGGVGDRFVLWQWVALSVGNKWLLGKEYLQNLRIKCMNGKQRHQLKISI